MMVHPNFDPVALQLGPISVQWYGLMYLVGFAAGCALGIYRAGQTQKLSGVPVWTKDDVMDLLFYVFVGVILGGRLGYALFYNFSYYVDNPTHIVRIWEGGMSFHGGLANRLELLPRMACNCPRKVGRSFGACSQSTSTQSNPASPTISATIGDARLIQIPCCV